MWLGEELDGGIVAGSMIGFSGSSWKTSLIVSHSHLISQMSFCSLTWKEEVVRGIETLADQHVGRRVGGSKGLNGPWIGSPQWN